MVKLVQNVPLPLFQLEHIHQHQLLHQHLKVNTKKINKTSLKSENERWNWNWSDPFHTLTQMKNMIENYLNNTISRDRKKKNELPIAMRWGTVNSLASCTPWELFSTLESTFFLLVKNLHEHVEPCPPWSLPSCESTNPIKKIFSFYVFLLNKQCIKQFSDNLCGLKL